MLTLKHSYIDCTCWCQDMECFPHYGTFARETHQSLEDFLYKEPVRRSFDVFAVDLKITNCWTNRRVSLAWDAMSLMWRRYNVQHKLTKHYHSKILSILWPLYGTNNLVSLKKNHLTNQYAQSCWRNPPQPIFVVKLFSVIMAVTCLWQRRCLARRWRNCIDSVWLFRYKLDVYTLRLLYSIRYGSGLLVIWIGFCCNISSVGFTWYVYSYSSRG